MRTQPPPPDALQTELFSGGGSILPDRLTAWAPMDWAVAAGWRPVVERFFVSEPGRRLGQFVGARLQAGAIVYPPQPLRALELTAPESVRVVILGQDPYHGPGQAEGLAFSVANGQKLPPSLRNILQERARDLALDAGAVTAGGSLVSWAKQGVLLLNTCLTVEDGCPASHAGQGWEALTDALLRMLLDNPLPLVFMLWGSHAQKVAQVAGLHFDGRHLVLCANHPSPLSARRPPAPFAGCGHFSRANAFLLASGRGPVRW